MKTFNTKLIVALFTTLVLTGCMPDSLTKFKKDAPKKAPIVSETDTEEEVPTTVPDGAGGVISLPDLVDATTFSYPESNDLVFEAGVDSEFPISGDNSFASQTTRESLIQSCSVTPTLPPGIGIDSETCAISGTPSQVYVDTTKVNIVQKGKKDFVVTVKFLNKDAGVTTLTRAITLQALKKPTKLEYTQSSKVLLKVTGSLATFSSNSGDIRSDDGEAPSYVGKNSVYGTVETLDLVNNIVGVNNKRNYDYQGVVTTFTDADSDYQPDIDPSNPKYYFRVGDDLDNDSVYSQALATIVEVKNIFPTYTSAPTVSPSLQPMTIANTGVNIEETSAARNYLEFTVSPKLPTGFTLNAITGKITGYSTVPVAMKTYQITASNALGSASYKLQLEIIDPPAKLSLTKKQVLTVGALTYGYLKEGDIIVSAPSATPAPTSVHGIITKMIPASLQLEVATLDGSFAKSDPIDLGKTFNAMIGTVLTTPINFNAAVTTAAPVSIPAGGLAIGTTMYAHNNSAVAVVSDRVYLTATDTADIKTGDLILGSAINEIDAETLKVNLVAATPGLQGLDVLSLNAKASGYVYEQASTTSIYISNLFRSINLTDVASRSFRHADVLKFEERSTTVGVAIGSTAGDIAYDNYFVAERGVYSEYKSNLVTGSGITYSISPALPLGMSLSPTTGVISGTPTVRSANDNYVITAKNLLLASSVNIRFEVRDYFTLSETSGAPSYKLHRVGDYQNSNSCRVNAADIFNERGHRDIRCFMDGEEQDIHSFGMKLKASVGPGICKFVSITPYQFWKWSPKTTNGTVVRWENINTTLLSDREITADADCDGNYTLEGGPNCDEGSITVHTYKYDPDAAFPESFSNTKTISCGGKASRCLDGPIRDVLDDNAILSGARGTITSSDTGFNKTWDFSSPASKGDKTNLRIANNLYTTSAGGAKGSKCSASQAHVDININLNFANLSTLYPILDTVTPLSTGPVVPFYDTAVEKEYYSSSRYEVNGYPRGRFYTENGPRAVKPYKIVKVTSKYSPFDGALPYYQVSCLDAAKEALATVNIVVRDWNQKFKLQHEIDKESPDLVLTPILMRATAGGTVVNPTNDFADWMDNYSQSTSPTLRPANNPVHTSCGTAPVYALPATSAAVPGMVYPAATEFQFPEGSL